MKTKPCRYDVFAKIGETITDMMSAPAGSIPIEEIQSGEHTARVNGIALPDGTPAGEAVYVGTITMDETFPDFGKAI